MKEDEKHMVCNVREMKIMSKILVGKPEGKRSPGFYERWRISYQLNDC
jgi:hypothetical protein